MLRIFDWGHDPQHTPSNLDIWFDGELLPDSAHLFYAEMADEPGQEVDGLLGFYAHNWRGKVFAVTDNRGRGLDSSGPVAYYERGKVIWRWREGTGEGDLP